MTLLRSVATWAWGLAVAIAILVGVSGMGLGLVATVQQLVGVK